MSTTIAAHFSRNYNISKISTTGESKQNKSFHRPNRELACSIIGFLRFSPQITILSVLKSATTISVQRQDTWTVTSNSRHQTSTVVFWSIHPREFDMYHPPSCQCTEANVQPITAQCRRVNRAYRHRRPIAAHQARAAVTCSYCGKANALSNHKYTSNVYCHSFKSQELEYFTQHNILPQCMSSDSGLLLLHVTLSPADSYGCHTPH